MINTKIILCLHFITHDYKSQHIGSPIVYTLQWRQILMELIWPAWRTAWRSSSQSLLTKWPTINRSGEWSTSFPLTTIHVDTVFHLVRTYKSPVPFGTVYDFQTSGESWRFYEYCGDCNPARTWQWEFHTVNILFLEIWSIYGSYINVITLQITYLGCAQS